MRRPFGRKKGSPFGSHKKNKTSQLETPAFPAGAVRLQKLIAEAGLASRRGAEDLIAAGRVAINGEVVTEQGLKIDPNIDRVTVNGRPLPPPEKLRYYMFHKPAGFLTTVFDPQGRPTIKGWLDKVPGRVFPVGRLDMDVEGLLILTNDGDLAKRLMHPSSKVPKVYRVKVAGLPKIVDLERLRSGDIMIDDRPAAPAEVELLKSARHETDKVRSWLLLTLTEGRPNQVKRMCSAIGHPVLKLKRISYASLTLGTLPRESLRPLFPAEVAMLKEAVGLR